MYLLTRSRRKAATLIFRLSDFTSNEQKNTYKRYQLKRVQSIEQFIVKVDNNFIKKLNEKSFK